MKILLSEINAYVESIGAGNKLAMAYATDMGLSNEIIRINIRQLTCKENTKEYKGLLKQKRAERDREKKC